MRELHGGREAANAYFSPYLHTLKGCLHRSDWETFAETLEELQIAETRFIVEYLAERGLEEASAIRIPFRAP